MGLLASTVVVGAVRWVAVPDEESFVVRSGQEFVLGGEPFRFVGFNLYDAAATSGYSCRPATMMSDAQLVQALSWAKEEAGASVIRFWAYQSYTRSATDFSGVDRVVAAARENGLKVLPVLDDGPGDCSGVPGRFPKADLDGGKWYETGYRQVRPPATLSYRDYVAEIVAHYRDDPTILGWSMMNEAETWERDAQGRSVVVDFARDVGSVIRVHDPRH
ncbi:MAG: cellulase family glycosylhydrolase, partial [Kineosporiaceae bacterium]